MAHVKRRLPARPHLDVPRRQARELLAQWRAKIPDAFDRIRSAHPAYRAADAAALSAAPFRLSDAQLVIAREYSFVSWAELKQRITANAVSVALERALRGGDRDAIVQLLRDHPQLLHVPVRSGNWGPPMSFAANLGRLDVVQAIAALGAHDHQHAFDRALLRGNIACARWLYGHGAGVSPDSILGPCETLDPAGLRGLSLRTPGRRRDGPGAGGTRRVAQRSREPAQVPRLARAAGLARSPQHHARRMGPRLPRAELGHPRSAAPGRRLDVPRHEHGAFAISVPVRANADCGLLTR